MPSLNPNTNFELKLLERKEALINPFLCPACDESCERVLNFLATIQDKFANQEKIIDGEEFFLTMPTIAAFEQQIYLFEAIVDHSEGILSDEQIKAVLVAFLASHTVIWSKGVPSAKVGLYGNWTRKTEMFEIELMDGIIEDNKPTNKTAIVNDLQFVLIEKLWTRKSQNNSVKARKL